MFRIKKIFIVLCASAALLSGCDEAVKNGQGSVVPGVAYFDKDGVPRDKEGNVPKPRPYSEPLPDTVRARTFGAVFASPEALLDTLIHALEKRDTLTLQKLLVSKKEYRQWLWPEYPASWPVLNMPVEFAWGNLQAKTFRGLRYMIRTYGGQPLAYVSHSFEKKDPYQTFTIHERPHVVVADTTGKEIELKEIGSIVEMNGSYKLISFREPR